MKHILSAKQFNQQDLLSILHRSREMETIAQSGGSDIAKGKILVTLFYEPSTRTRLSFESAMFRLGGQVVSETNVMFSSQTKGEVLADTIRIVGGYADIIAIRSQNIGDADISAQYSTVPIINGGDGSGEHPTQGLLDLYTIWRNFQPKLGKERIKIAYVGDLKYGRTVHSLCTFLRNFEGFEMTFVAPEDLQIPDTYFNSATDRKLSTLSDDVLSESDIIYDTRIQKERFEDPELYEKYRQIFVFNKEKVSLMKEEALLLHPLPRVNEITFDVDKMPQAHYFQQAQNGMYLRMALIAQCLEL